MAGSVGPEVIGTVLAVQGSNVVLGLLPAATTGARPLSVGELIVMPASQYVTVGLVHALRHGRRTTDQDPIAELQILGEITSDQGRARFWRGISAYPVLDAPAIRADSTHSRIVYAAPSGATMRLGTLRHAEDVPALALIDNLLGKHFAVLGSTGSGKSCAVALLLHSLIDQCRNAHVMILDPHGEYSAAFKGRAEVLEPGNLELPYWLMSFDETAAVLAPGHSSHAYAEGSILREAILQARIEFAGGTTASPITVDTPVPYRLSDVAKIINTAMGNLNKPETLAPYRHLLNRIESIRNDRRYAFLFQSLVVRDSMEQVLGRLFRFPVNHKPITIFDISGVPSEVVDVVVSLICRLVFEFGLWSARERLIPLLLVCEEAHRYVPNDHSKGFEPSRLAIERIAKEGRKYGVSIGLVSQRPAEISVSSLSQCGTVMALRLTNERDQRFVENVLPEGNNWLRSSLPALGTGEAIVIGDGVNVPMHVRLDQLPPDRQPASQTPTFTKIWSEEKDHDVKLVGDTIRRWREQRR